MAYFDNMNKKHMSKQDHMRQDARKADEGTEYRGFKAKGGRDGQKMDMYRKDDRGGYHGGYSKQNRSGDSRDFGSRKPYGDRRENGNRSKDERRPYPQQRPEQRRDDRCPAPARPAPAPVARPALPSTPPT